MINIQSRVRNFNDWNLSVNKFARRERAQITPANCSWTAENHYFTRRELLVLFGSLT